MRGANPLLAVLLILVPLLVAREIARTSASATATLVVLENCSPACDDADAHDLQVDASDVKQNDLDGGGDDQR